MLYWILFFAFAYVVYRAYQSHKAKKALHRTLKVGAGISGK